jgi:hypothetical protein
LAMKSQPNRETDQRQNEGATINGTMECMCVCSSDCF